MKDEVLNASADIPYTGNNCATMVHVRDGIMLAVDIMRRKKEAEMCTRQILAINWLTLWVLVGGGQDYFMCKNGLWVMLGG